MFIGGQMANWAWHALKWLSSSKPYRPFQPLEIAISFLNFCITNFWPRTILLLNNKEKECYLSHLLHLFFQPNHNFLENKTYAFTHLHFLLA